MAVSYEYMMQTESCLQQALAMLGTAQSYLSRAIATDTMLPPSGDPDSSTWATLQTDIATAISDINTAIAAVSFTPESIL